MHPSLTIACANIVAVVVPSPANIINDSAYNFYKHNNLKNEKFDLIFLDPPFKEQNIYFIIKNIIDLKILQKNGIIILHRHKKTKDDLGKKILIERSIKYGISKIIFCKLVT